MEPALNLISFNYVSVFTGFLNKGNSLGFIIEFNKISKISLGKTSICVLCANLKEKKDKRVVQILQVFTRASKRRFSNKLKYIKPELLMELFCKCPPRRRVKSQETPVMFLFSGKLRLVMILDI